MSVRRQMGGIAAILALGAACTTGTPDFEVRRKSVAYDRPFAPGARVEVNLESHLRLANPFDPRRIAVDHITGSSSGAVLPGEAIVIRPLVRCRALPGVEATAATPRVGLG